MTDNTTQDTTESKQDQRPLISRAPLLFLIPVSALILSVVGLYASGSAYAKYDALMHDSPPVALVMSGLADGIYPWSASTRETESGQEDSLLSDNAKKPEGNSDDGVKANASSEYSAEANDDSQNPGSRIPDSKENNNAEDHEGSTDTDAAGDNGIDKDTAINNDNTSVSDNSSTEEKEATDEPPYSIPPESTCPVCEAKDYGIAQKRFLSPEGWEADYDTEGMFAPCGVYRSFTEVDESYFADALYIGDSRIEGLCDYAGLEDQATFAYKNSLSIYKLFDEMLTYHDSSGTRASLSLDQILSMTGYGKIYLQIGINEVGVGNTKTFYEEYRNVLQRIRAKQPLAIIYIDGIMHVTAAKSSSDPVFTNVNIVDKNKAISKLANGRNIFYLDVNPAVCDENGNLLSELTIDHAHLKAAPHERWREFLLTHAILPEAAR